MINIYNGIKNTKRGMAIKYQFIPYLWIPLSLTIIMITLILYAWKNRIVLGARYFLATLILVEVWIVSQALEMAALDLQIKLVWANIQYIPIMLTPVTYLYLVLQLNRRDSWLKQRWLFIVLLIAPVCINLLLWTNDYHGLIRQNIHLSNSGSFPTIEKTFGPLYWLFALINYGVTIISMTILGKALREKTSLYRQQTLLLIISLLLPTVSTFFQIMGLNPFSVDTTPAIFGLSAVTISWGIFRYRLFDVVPIARSIIIQEMSIGMIVLDHEGRLLDINPAAKEMLNRGSIPLIGLSIETAFCDTPELVSLYKKGKNAQCELVFKYNEGLYYYEVSFTKLEDSYQKYLGSLLQIYNITERKRTEGIIQHAAFHDALTGLPNRNYFQVLFSQELSRARRYGELLVVAYLDLDDFKSINDTYGHDAGDSLLCEVAKRLKDVVRQSDIVSRIGGDEYVIVLPNLKNINNIKIIGNKILKTFEKSFNIDDVLMHIQASIGFSVFPRDGDNIEVLLKKADKAMYMVKLNVKNSYSIYEYETGSTKEVS